MTGNSEPKDPAIVFAERVGTAEQRRDAVIDSDTANEHALAFIAVFPNAVVDTIYQADDHARARSHFNGDDQLRM